MGRGKGKLNRKMSANVFIYDDGFILEIAYLLCLLNRICIIRLCGILKLPFFENAKNYWKEMTNNNAGKSAKMK